MGYPRGYPTGLGRVRAGYPLGGLGYPEGYPPGSAGVPHGVPLRVRGGTPWGTPADPGGYPPGYPLHTRWLLPPRERDSQKIFFALYRPNFDDLRPLKAKIGTFEHLWGSKTWFCAADFSWFFYQRQVDF